MMLKWGTKEIAHRLSLSWKKSKNVKVTVLNGPPFNWGGGGGSLTFFPVYLVLKKRKQKAEGGDGKRSFTSKKRGGGIQEKRKGREK